MEYIEINKLEHHPKNPRKGFGDLSELADSIKANGVLQNLTVVINPETGKGYWVVIGNRRLEAAKLAGLKELPCTISTMDEKTQQSTMLLENMQRSDLTPYEQAEGFQMCLDLGMTENDLKAQTGFSKKTIKHRLKMLELDQDKVKSATERGGTIQDYIDLEKIEDVKVKNELLDLIGTDKFRYSFNNKLQIQNDKKAINDLIDRLSMHMHAVDVVPDDYKYVQYISAYGSKNYKLPEDVDTLDYVFKVFNDCDYIQIYREKTEEDIIANQQEEDDEPSELDKNLEKIEQMRKAAFETRLDYAKCHYKFHFEAGELAQRYAFYLISGKIEGSAYYSDIEKIFKQVTEKSFEDITDEDFKKIENRGALLFALVYACLEYQEGYSTVHTYKHSEDYCSYNDLYVEEYRLLYDFLENLATEYEPSEEERQIIFGTHPLYKKMDKGEEDEN